MACSALRKYRCGWATNGCAAKQRKQFPLFLRLHCKLSCEALQCCGNRFRSEVVFALQTGRVCGPVTTLCRDRKLRLHYKRACVCERRHSVVFRSLRLCSKRGCEAVNFQEETVSFWLRLGYKRVCVVGDAVASVAIAFHRCGYTANVCVEFPGDTVSFGAVTLQRGCEASECCGI
jgi:hypothetical protein